MLKILIADDGDFRLKGLGEVLKNEGHEVETVDSADTAIEIISHKTVDLIIAVQHLHGDNCDSREINLRSDSAAIIILPEISIPDIKTPDVEASMNQLMDVVRTSVLQVVKNVECTKNVLSTIPDGTKFNSCREALDILKKVISPDVQTRYFVGNFWQSFEDNSKKGIGDIVDSLIGRMPLNECIGAYLINVVVQSLYQELILADMEIPGVELPKLSEQKRLDILATINLLVRFTYVLGVDIISHHENGQPFVEIRKPS